MECIFYSSSSWFGYKGLSNKVQGNSQWTNSQYLGWGEFVKAQGRCFACSIKLDLHDSSFGIIYKNPSKRTCHKLCGLNGVS